MALLHVNFFSDVLAISASMDVILPQKVSRQVGMGSAGSDKPLPVLYLLHGMSDDHTIWQRRTSIERYVAELPLIVVMPTTGRGAYTDMKHGYRYWTYISEELPQIVHEFFPQASWRREDTFAAGLSMGGYGAFKLGLRCPDKFGTLLAAGITSSISVQAFLNMGVVVGILPTTGLPLPFFSAGGTSISITMAAIGILLNISRESAI